MSYEEDFLLRQFKLIGQGMAKGRERIFVLKKSAMDLGEVTDQHGNVVSANELLQEYLNTREIHLAYLLITKKKYQLSYLNMSRLTAIFLKFLETLPVEEKETLKLDTDQLTFYKEELNKM